MNDLHLHSTASDGALSPSLLVRRAREAGLGTVALTDHDTLAGIPEAAAEGRRRGIAVVPGVELSLPHAPGTFHLIGLFVDPGDAGLAAALERIREGRAERNRKLLERLSGLGLPLGVEEVEAEGGGVTARPHFARAMLRRGYVASEKEAFDRFLGKGACAYVDRLRLSPREAIDLIHGAGGVAVLCHPATLLLPDRAGPGGLAHFTAGLAALGLDALEVWGPDPDGLSETRLLALASATGLLPAGGSDFHGRSPREVRPSGRVPDEALEALRERSRRYRPSPGA